LLFFDASRTSRNDKREPFEFNLVAGNQQQTELEAGSWKLEASAPPV
jgi:hypothetical protein